MHVGHVELPVRDPVASRRFYVDTLGFELVSDQGPKFFWVRRGGVEILLRPGAPTPPADPADAIGLVLYTDDLPRAVERLTSRGLSLERKGACYRFRDPDGHGWQLVDPRDDHSADA